MTIHPAFPAGGPEAGPDHAALLAALPELSRARVLVVGDAMLDRYLYGFVQRISPEAPIPIVAVEREVTMPGGAGHVMRNLTALGAVVSFVSVVGDDQAGSDLTGLIGGQSNVEPWLLIESGRPTTVKTRYIALGQQLLRADQEVRTPIPVHLAERLLRIAVDALAATSAIVLSDYAKSVLAGDLAPRLIAAARAAGRRIVVDPHGPDFGAYAGADVITPNRPTLRAATGRDVSTEAGVIAAAEALRAAHGFGAVLTTRGEGGMILLDDTGPHHFSAEAAEVYDISGAKDTAVAILAAGVAVGLAVPVAACLANLAAGIAVGKVGTAIVTAADLSAAVSPTGGAPRKIVTREAAAEHMEQWRRRGRRTGFTNGCFDLLHPGHVSLLEQARARCDRLVVGLNSDASVARLKGDGRPVQTEAARAAVLASLGVVDLVVVFDENTPEALIRTLRPDLLVKGADYRIDGVVGAELVRGWGGQVLLAELLPGHSITETVARPDPNRHASAGARR